MTFPNRSHSLNCLESSLSRRGPRMATGAILSRTNAAWSSLLCRLVALVPAPRFHTVRYFGVLAPAAKWRPLVVPKPPPAATTQDASSCAPCETSTCPESVGSRYRPWAELMKKTFAVDVEICPRCGGRMRLLAVITEPQNVARFLRHRGEPTEPPARAPPRDPPYFKTLVVRRRPSNESSPQGELFEEH